jgi:hypothetical protein
MGLQVQSRDIGGVTYEVQQLPARRSMKLLARLGRLVAPLVSVAQGAAKAGGFQKLDSAVLAQSIGGLFDALPPDEVEPLLSELFASTCIIEPSGARQPLWPVFDLRMQGKAFDVLRLAAFAVEVNFSDFFDALRAGAPQGAEGEPSRSPST